MKIYILCFLIYFSLEYSIRTISLNSEFTLSTPYIVIKGDDIDQGDTLILEIGNACNRNFNVQYSIYLGDDDDHIGRDNFERSTDEFREIVKKEDNNKNGKCISTYEIDIYADEDLILVKLDIKDLKDLTGLTIKAYKKSYLWIIFVIIGSVILIAAIAVGIYLFLKKRSNKSIINEPLSPEEEPVFKPSEENSNW